jgi:dTDP-L-rhamnose 4-epimerase
MENLTALVTGGAGFIGGHLIKKLNSLGINTIVLDNFDPKIHNLVHEENSESTHQLSKIIVGDIRNRALVKECIRKADILIHLASETGTGQSMYDIENYTSVNVLGTSIILDCLMNSTHKIKRFILASSRSVYGEGSYICTEHGTVTPASRLKADLDQKKWNPVCPVCGEEIFQTSTKENALIQPASIYALTKFTQEELVSLVCRISNVPFSILRLQNVYGSGQSLNNPYTGILSIFSNRIRQNLPIAVFEDGMESRDFVHVSDVVHAIMLTVAVDTYDSFVLNIGSGIPTTVLEIANLLFENLKGSEISLPKVSGDFRVGDIRHAYADISDARRILRWSPQVSIEQGITTLVEWVKQQPIHADGSEFAMSELKRRRLSS